MNCKPGDLAVIVRARNPENVGRIVEVVSRAANGEKRMSAVGEVSVRVEPGEIVWLIRCVSKLISTNRNRSTRQEVHYGDHEAWICDSKLRPISGVSIDDDVTEDLKESA